MISASDPVTRLQRDTADYLIDAWQRGALTLDVLRERGDIFLAHLIAGKPPLLQFEHELLIDGRSLPAPCNYALLRIVPPPGVTPDPVRRPIVIIDPRAGHGPGIGGFKPDSEVGVALKAGHAGDRFDGAWLVSNFENLNLGNTWWGKYDHLYANVDTERERFLEFERWWGGYFRMTGEEIESIVENLFVGNRLARGEVVADGVTIDLRNITSPIVIFASWGDNITPPQQALNWIIDAWGSEKALVAAGRTIVYMLHPTIGHLGIFVGGAVARKEHDQIVNTLDLIERLPPGLHEMKIVPKDPGAPFADLEPGGFSVQFEPRTVDDIRALDPDGRRDEAMFSTVAQVSEANMAAYRTLWQPWVKAVGSRPLGDALRWLHPLRQQHLALSSFSPAAPWVREAARRAEADRRPAEAGNVWRAWERLASDWITESLNRIGGLRDDGSSRWVTFAYGPQGLGALLPPQASDETAALARAETSEAEARRIATGLAEQGGFPEAVCRLVLAGLSHRGVIERRTLRLGQLIARSHREMAAAPGARHAARPSAAEWKAVLERQTLVMTFAGDEAMAALPRLLPAPSDRERAVALAAAVLMMAPALADPASPASRAIRERLGVDPARVAALALSLAQTVDSSHADDPDGPPPPSPPSLPAPATSTARRRRKAAA